MERLYDDIRVTELPGRIFFELQKNLYPIDPIILITNTDSQDVLDTMFSLNYPFDWDNQNSKEHGNNPIM